MAPWMNLGQHLKLNAKKYPGTVALKDAHRSLTYPMVNNRVNRLAHALFGMGLSKGDKVAVLMENSIEIVEVYLARAKTGTDHRPHQLPLGGPGSGLHPGTTRMPRPSSSTTSSSTRWNR